jgi:aspartyl/asparaginyl beta-hydroxylase (cupin superfamily)
MGDSDDSGGLRLASAALQSARFADAKALFEALVSKGSGGSAAWLGLARSHAGLGEDAAATAAVDRALALEPGAVQALLFKADGLARAGQPRAALAHYRQALKAAGADRRQVTPQTGPGLIRAQAMVARFEAEYADYLLSGLRERGYRAGAASNRFDLALDVCLGRRRVYYQEPTRFYFPELPQRQFYERCEFPWLAELEGATRSICEELREAAVGRSGFQPYVRSSRDFSGTDPATRFITDNADWGALYLWEYGSMVAANVQRFARTFDALECAPLPRITGQLPMALFSRLAPRMKIPPHHGMLNIRLICHLPLVVPPDCGALRCGSEQRAWVKGETMIFDDSIEHEAWNDSDQERIVLLFDIWRPELTPDERRLVTDLLEVVKEYSSVEG